LKGYVAATDFDWYRRLAGAGDLEEVNFWQPSGYRAIRSIQPGEPFLFKLKSPHNAICGFGLFARGSELPASLAWEAFQKCNGVESLEELLARIARYRASVIQPGEDPHIGCQMVAQPVFFPQTEWVSQPGDWPPQTQVAKIYDLETGEGARVWTDCLARSRGSLVVAEPGPRYGAPQLVKPRLGQGIFRIAVLDAYERSCAVTGEHSLPVLEAAHILPYKKGGEHQVSNGLLLRSDLHRLFDKGYVTVTPELVFKVSPRLRDEWRNGRTYYPLDGAKLRVPPQERERPDPEMLTWHNQNVFKRAVS